MNDTGVKICGLTRSADALGAERAGATHAGVIFARGRRSVTPAAAREILEGVSLRRVGVFVNASPKELVAVAAAVPLQVLQLHGDETPEQIARVRQGWDGEVWKALRPRGADEFLSALERYERCVDGILLDGWSPLERGGTGSRFPWEELAPVRDSVPPSLSLIVAGGLDADNVRSAIRLLRPDLVDVSSGVESAPGIKDTAMLERFVASARGGMKDHPIPSRDV